jgi:signal transduction histidine kinase
MSNPLRFFVLVLVLVSLGASAATLQLHAHRRARELMTGLDITPAVRTAMQDRQTHHQRAFLSFVAISLVAVVVVALVPAPRRETPPDLERLRTDMTQVDRLARANIAQSEALTRERDARIRTEATLHLHQLRLNQALEEKIRLGRDLHDGIIQSLYATGLTLESARQKRVTQPEEADTLVERGIQLLNTTIRDVRGYIDTLGRSASPGADGFAAELSAMLEALRGHREVVFSVHLDEAAVSQLGDNRRSELLQIVREAASNALRHGEARHVTVRLHEDGVRLALLVQDDGRGFDPQTISRPGLGLANLQARTVSMKGDLRVTSRPGEGARLVITIPANPPA